MPWYRHGGVVMHLHMSAKQRKKAPAACLFWRSATRTYTDGSKERVLVRCLAIAAYLCDWPGCNAPFCESHRLNLGPDLDVCPTHNHRRGLFSRLLPAPPPLES